MPITYKLWKKKFKTSENQEVEKYLACKHTTYTVSTKEIAEQIMQGSTHSIGDVTGCISEISEKLKLHLSLGHNVTLDGIGTFSISLTSNKIDSRKDLSKLRVWAKRVTFRQDSELKEILKRLHFQYISGDPLIDEIEQEEEEND